MGLFKDHFHWHALALLPVGAVSIVLGTAVVLRTFNHPVAASLFFVAAGAGIAIRFAHAAVTGADYSKRNRATFAVVCVTPVAAVTALVVVDTLWPQRWGSVATVSTPAAPQPNATTPALDSPKASSHAAAAEPSTPLNATPLDRRTNPGPGAPQSAGNENGAVLASRERTLFIDCRMGTMPSAVAAPGRVYALLTSHLPVENGGGGLAEYFSTSATGGEFAWTRDKSPAWAYRCDVTNYADEVLVDVVMNFWLTFRKPLEVPGQPNALKQGEVTLDRPWPITIAKVDRGPESPFTFYVWNCCVDRFVKVRALPEAVAQGNGPMRLGVRQSATNLYQELNPTSLWLKGVR